MSGITKWDKALLGKKGRETVAKYEATIADLNADLRQAEHERNVLRNARLCKATCRDQKERLKRENADLRARLAAEKERAEAAVKDLKAIATYYDSCLCCKDYTAGLVAKSTCCSGWEWRGDRETEESKRIATPACGIGVSPQDMGGDHGTEGER